MSANGSISAFVFAARGAPLSAAAPRPTPAPRRRAPRASSASFAAIRLASAGRSWS